MKRAEWVCFDECGWLMEEVFQVIEPYTAQNKDFKMGGGIDVSTLPRELPNQLMYTSSASSVDSYFYDKYRQYSKMMFLGSKDHFVADINCEVVINATFKGKLYSASLLSQAKVDNAMRENKEKALREYYNKFTEDAGANAVVRRGTITRNSIVRPPVLVAPDNERHMYGFAYDPARSLDNSFVLIGEYYKDERVGWKLRLLNGVNFADYGLRNKTPMRTPEQIEHLKKLILDYNGPFPDYDNIHVIFIDAGSGGAGVNIADFLMPDWYENGKDGIQKFKHAGLIDKEYSAEHVRKFPNAINKIRLISPVKFKSEIYRAFMEMSSQDLIEFPAEYNNKGYLTIIEVDEKIMRKKEAEIRKRMEEEKIPADKFQELLEEQLAEVDGARTKLYTLTPEEEVALTQIDSMKEELVNMVKIETPGERDRFELTKEKQGKLHDDRAYCMALLAYGLQELRRADILAKAKTKDKHIARRMPIRRGKVHKMIG